MRLHEDEPRGDGPCVLARVRGDLGRPASGSRPGLGVAAAAAMIAGMAGPAVASTTPPGSDESVSVIVREAPDAGDRPERAVEAAGGSVVRQLPWSFSGHGS